MTEVILRPFALSDATAFAEAVNQSLDTLLPWMTWAHENYRPEEAVSWFNFAHAERVRGEAERFAIADSHHRLLGGAGVRFARQPGEVAALGYWVRSDAQRQGVATRAVAQLITLGFSRPDITELEILAATDNVASRAVALRSGFTLTGCQHGLIVLPDGPVEAAVYRLKHP
ncbi:MULTISPECIES: GNAT family N-acetyltransferase [Pantoea]|uniref:GNAT family N-acetyltransferase n=1 Tax=Pantoea TaxID=53335 RepID=UPI00259864E3|nr:MULTISPECIES: GNAT family N-acetyltransferase [Pantoea]